MIEGPQGDGLWESPRADDITPCTGIENLAIGRESKGSNSARMPEPGRSQPGDGPIGEGIAVLIEKGFCFLGLGGIGSVLFFRCFPRKRAERSRRQQDGKKNGNQATLKRGHEFTRVNKGEE